jgi:hypothetical protein
VATRQVSAEEFEAKCLELLIGVAETRESLIVTMAGIAIARVEPPERSLIGSVTYNISDEELVHWSAGWEDDRELLRAEGEG